MSKIYKLFSAIMTFMVLYGVLSAQTIEIGTGTSTTARPMPGLWGWQYDVYLYTPSDAVELNSALTITGIGYNISSNSTSTGAQLTIWMKDVDAGYALDASTTFANYTSGATQVYNTTALTTTAGWNTFNFSSNFQHTAGKAILVAVLGKGCTTSGGCSRYCYYTSMSDRHWSKYADSSDPGTSVSGSLDANLVNVRLIRYCVARTGTFEFRNGSTAVTSTINHLIGNSFTAPTLVNNITPSGTPTYTSSNTAVATVDPTTGAVTFTGQEGLVTITAYVQATDTYCEKMTSYTINVNNGCVKVGTGTATTYLTPLNNNYKYSLTEMIYLSDEIGYPDGGTIDRIGFQYAYGTAMTAKTNVKIYMANTTRSAFASGAVSEFITEGLQLVYSGALNCSGNGVWNYFDLTSEFDYDGGNLLVVVDDNSGAYNSSSYVFNSTTTTGYTVWRYQSDGTYYSVSTISNYTSSCTYSTSRVNTAFCISEPCTHRTGTFAFSGPSTYTYVVGSGDFVEPTLQTPGLSPSNGTITYESNNPSVATVASNGNVTFTGVEGVVTITAVSTLDGYCRERASYTIQVGDGCLKIGTGTSTTSSTPLMTGWKQSYEQMIYTPAEVGGAGLINQIGFQSAGTNTYQRTIDIYMGETNVSSFGSASTSEFIDVNQLQLVYSGTWDITEGWQMFPVNFLYYGMGNLVVAVDCGAPNYSSSSFYYTSTTDYTTLYCYSDTYDAVPATITTYQGSVSRLQYRPNTKICMDRCTIVPENFGFSNSIAMCYLGGQPTITLDRDGNNAAATYVSSDPSVADVDENGIITTHSLGTTQITVTVPLDGDVCPARASYELQVICPAAIPSAQSVWVCDPQTVNLTATVRDDEGNLELRWYDGVLSDTPINTGENYTVSASSTTTYYVAAYNTEQHCYSSRVPSTVHVFDVQYDATTTNMNGYVGVPMYGYAPDGSHEGATFSANGMPAWMTLNSDGSFSGTPTAAGSGSFTITATNSMGCTIIRNITWTVTANNLNCCEFDAFYIYQDGNTFPLHLADDGYYYADVCLNTAMTLRVQKLNTCSGTYTYTWRLTSSTGGLIQEFTGSQFTYTYDRTAGYGVMLVVKRNNNDCVSIPVRVRVAGVFQVATRPSFNLCHGEPFNIYVSTDGVGAIDVVRPSGGAATTLGVSDTILLPDGEPCDGNCFYRSSVTFSDFSAGATIRNANDLLYVMLNIEHTFIGDIYIAITCPSGRRSVILSQCGSGSATCHAQIPSGYDSWVSGVGTSNHGANFGNPNSGNSSSCDPNASGNELGIGWNYIWSENTSRGYTYAGGTGLIYDDANVHNSTVDSSDLANMSQIYVPQETFNNLIGCPLNGTWSIEVVDGWGGDNGHIFNWELGLNEELLPDSWSYEVDLDSSWVTCGWNSTKSGVYMEITPPDNFDGTSSCDLFLRDEYGCVSTYENIVTVTMNPTVHSELVVDGGQCEPYTWARNNQTYTASGTYVDAGLTPQGCPDTATLILTVAGSVFDTVSAQSCESYTWDATGQTYTQSGTYTANLVTAMGCDSIITLNLTISNEITVPHDTVICPDNFPLNDWYGDWGDFAAAGSLQQHFTTANGCDSLVVLTVQAYPKPDVSLPPPPGAGGCPLTAGSYVITPTITNAQAPYSYNWTGDYVGATPTASIPASVTCGTFTETLYFTDANGCMDTATVTFSAVDDVAPYFLNDMPDYSEVSAVAMGQDCRFRIPDIVGILQPADNCGVSEMVQLPLPLNDITEPTTVEVIVTDRCGLQTRRYITVTVPDPLSANELAHTNVSCAGRSDGTVTLSGVTGGSPQYHYSWSSSGTGATNVSSQTGTTLSNLAPGIYTVTITDDAECSIQKSVTVGIDGEASTNVESFTACDSFTWHGTTYTQSNNTATYTTTNAEGCDSTVTLNLTVNHSSSGIDSHTECDSYTWPMNSQTYTSSTSSPSVPAGLNAAGCDSTVTLHLTINRSTTGTDVHTACDSYTWPLNGQTYTSSTNSPQVVITNRAGCDSTVTLRLTINNTRYGSYVDTVCYGEQLTYRGNRYPAGQHTVTITSAAGCDSVVALQVVARPQLSVNIEEYHSCELGHYQLTGSVSGSNNVSYRWTAHPSDPDVEIQRDELEISVNPSRSTDYTLTAGYGAGRLCSASQTISLSPLRLPVADITFNPPFLTCDDLEWTAHSASQNAESISWYVNDIEAGIDETISGVAQCDDDSVRISIVAVNGICTDVHDTVIYLRKSQLWFPNVFTPNLNINKTFAPIGHGIVEYEIYIYTREGLLVFHSTTLEEGWRGDHNGVECPRATYTYIARFRNEIEPDVWHKQIGTVTLLR